LALALLILGAFLFYQALQLSMRSLDGGPGPGFMPAGIGLLMVLLAAPVLLLRRRDRLGFGHLTRIGIMVGAVGVYTLVLERIGFVVATAIMMIVLLVAFNDRHRLPLAVLGVAGAALSYALFFSTLKKSA
jgi:hypothetical protein